jgi:hypothetical protein
VEPFADQRIMGSAGGFQALWVLELGRKARLEVCESAIVQAGGIDVYSDYRRTKRSSDDASLIGGVF